MASRIAKGGGSSKDFAEARAWLTAWRDNDAMLQPLLAGSSLSLELVPMSVNLSRTAAIGLEALTSIEDRKPTAAVEQERQLTYLKKEEAPEAVLLDAIVPGVELLLRGAGH